MSVRGNTGFGRRVTGGSWGGIVPSVAAPPIRCSPCVSPCSLRGLDGPSDLGNRTDRSCFLKMETSEPEKGKGTMNVKPLDLGVHRSPLSLRLTKPLRLTMTWSYRGIPISSPERPMARVNSMSSLEGTRVPLGCYGRG